MPQHRRDPSANALARGAANAETIEAARRDLARAKRFIRRKAAEPERDGGDREPAARRRDVGADAPAARRG